MLLNIKKKINESNGFSTDLHLNESELELARSLIREHWLSRLSKVASPALLEKFAQYGMDRYHELAHLVDHDSIWPKEERILPLSMVPKFLEMSIFKTLEKEFGSFILAWDEIYWRVVRPNQPKDIGPLHADKWFLTFGNGPAPPEGMQRVKIWVALYCEPGLNGLCMVPGSQLKEWKYHGEHRHGFIKPQIDEKIHELNSVLVPTKAGEAIVFNDGTLHGGALNQGQRTRVNFEFAIFVPKG